MYIKKILVAISLLGLVVFAIFSYKIYNAIFVPNTAFNNTKATLYIGSDAKFKDVVEDLTPLLKDIETFKQVAEKKKYSSNIKGGKYEIKKGMNNNDIVNVLRSKNIPVKVSFNNQESLAKLAGRISKQIEADSLSLLQSFTDMSFLDENNFSADTSLGMYIPNSYEFFWNTSADEFRGKMLTEYKKFWNDSRLSKAKKIGLTPNKVMALAAIVHKETVKSDERPRVAGVYMNRLKTGMLLQADPTVVFAVKKGTGVQLKRVLNKHLEINSPYNTYRNAGLPPGPIAMPDISAIDAVLNYERHNYYYFVADVKKIGYHKFAKTLSQHNRNAAEYHKWVSKIH
ncbi:endolytic transglycosylase MltG [Pseudofulvibacter geojedonensis]|uniref:Endolytic murein transglycosylase n=1 Tax=Pseudofulvibacter geojedonensis TaxID=1123758 RepID=A0ABW3HZ43_9FLAO